MRYRLKKNFANGTYIFLLGGDDGYRFSLDGDATWVINAWADQSYNTTSHTAILNGTYELVIEYYENGGDNRISFDMAGTVLPVKLVDFTANRSESSVRLDWIIATGSHPAYFDVERSQDGLHSSPSAGLPQTWTQVPISSSRIDYPWTVILITD